MKASVQITIDAKGAYVIFAGVDKTVSIGGTTYYVLQNNTKNYTLNLGVWCDNTTKVYTAAFMIVNRESVPIYIYDADFTAPSGVTVEIYLHSNASLPAEAFGGVTADAGAWELANNAGKNATKLAAAPTDYAKGSVNVRLYNSSASGWPPHTTTGSDYLDTGLSWVQSGTGNIWALTSFPSENGYTFETAVPGYSNCIFVYVKVTITNADFTKVNTIWTSLTIYMSSTLPSGYTEISA